MDHAFFWVAEAMASPKVDPGNQPLLERRASVAIPSRSLFALGPIQAPTRGEARCEVASQENCGILFDALARRRHHREVVEQESNCLDGNLAVRRGALSVLAHAALEAGGNGTAIVTWPGNRLYIHETV